MRLIRLDFIVCLYLTVFVFACSSMPAKVDLLNESLAKLGKEIVPDKRIGVFEIEALVSEAGIVLKGQTDQDDAKDRAMKVATDFGLEVIDSVQKLPAASLEGKVYGVVRNAVSNFRSKPGHSNELATQALLGTPLKVLERKGGWFRVQTPDKYIAWMDHGGFEQMNVKEFDSWQNKKKVIFVAGTGTAFTSPEFEEVVSDLVKGDILALESDNAVNMTMEVSYPDGRLAFVKKQNLRPIEAWLAEEVSVPEMIEDGKKLMGTPYLWGGTSVKGADCSGFTKTLFFMQGLVIPRDASQQVREGDLIETELTLQEYKAGDLLFFGNYRDDGSERVTHVGMYMGNDEMIHATGDPGRVHISNLNPSSDAFDAFNANRFLRSKRILTNDFTEGIEKVEELYFSKVFMDH